MTESEEMDLVQRRLRRGPRDKYVFVRGDQLCIIRAGTDLVQVWLQKSTWSLAGVWRCTANVQDVMEAIAATREEQRLGAIQRRLSGARSAA